jgi:hypothetical protein
MIVTFSTKSGQLTMLGESAVALVRLGGHSGAVPSAVLAADLPQFTQRLREGLVAHGAEPSPAPAADHSPRTDDEADDDDSKRPPAVTLKMRAVPLLDMLDTAIAQGSGLMWERG